MKLSRLILESSLSPKPVQGFSVVRQNFNCLRSAKWNLAAQAEGERSRASSILWDLRRAQTCKKRWEETGCSQPAPAEVSACSAWAWLWMSSSGAFLEAEHCSGWQSTWSDGNSIVRARACVCVCVQGSSLGSKAPKTQPHRHYWLMCMMCGLHLKLWSYLSCKCEQLFSMATKPLPTHTSL